MNKWDSHSLYLTVYVQLEALQNQLEKITIVQHVFGLAKIKQTYMTFKCKVNHIT